MKIEFSLSIFFSSLIEENKNFFKFSWFIVQILDSTEWQTFPRLFYRTMWKKRLFNEMFMTLNKHYCDHLSRHLCMLILSFSSPSRHRVAKKTEKSGQSLETWSWYWFSLLFSFIISFISIVVWCRNRQDRATIVRKKRSENRENYKSMKKVNCHK